MESSEIKDPAPKPAITTVQLREILERHHNDRRDGCKVRIRIAKPSMGPVATADVISANFGFDWDSGSFILYTQESLVPKSKQEEAYDIAHDLIMFLATKPGKRETYEVRTAKRCLTKLGYDQEKFDRYRKFFHKETTDDAVDKGTKD